VISEPIRNSSLWYRQICLYRERKQIQRKKKHMVNSVLKPMLSEEKKKKKPKKLPGDKGMMGRRSTCTADQEQFLTAQLCVISTSASEGHRTHVMRV
jgi:hypothetical protein